MRCRNQTISAGGTEIDFASADYTTAERIAAQNVIDLGDSDIDNGNTSGSRTSTIQFFDVVNSTYYYRTFTYTWTTNALSEVTSILDISDKF